MQLLVPQNTYIWFRVGGRYELSEEEVRQALKYRRFPNFPLTRAASLLFYASREKAGPGSISGVGVLLWPGKPLLFGR